MQRKNLLMTEEQYRKELSKLSNAQRRYIFDKTYISTNPKTKEVLIREGYIIPFEKRSKITNGIVTYSTQFTEKTHNIVKHKCEEIRKKHIEEFTDYIFIESDKQLLDIFSEIMLCKSMEKCYIDFAYNKFGFINTDYINYILHPYYRWLIEVDNTSGRFLTKVNSNTNRHYYLYYNKIFE
jgi:ribosomal protein S8